jgi:hypothetical protein
LPNIPNITETTERLLSVLVDGGFEYAIIGGLAVVLNGYDRFTRDVDAVVWDLDERLEDLIDLLQRHGFKMASPDQLQNARSNRILHISSEDDTAVDIFLGFLPFERETIDRALTMPFRDGVFAKVSSPDDLIIMKLIASRVRDNYDIAALLDLYPEVNKERIRRTVADYAEALDRPDILENMKEQLG